MVLVRNFIFITIELGSRIFLYMESIVTDRSIRDDQMAGRDGSGSKNSP